MSLFHASTYFEHHVLIVRRSKLYNILVNFSYFSNFRKKNTHLFQCDDARGCIVQFLPSDDEHMCSKHVEAWNKLIIKFSV